MLAAQQSASRATRPSASSGGATTTTASAPAIVQVHVFVSGRVQGVGFRDFTLLNARQRHLGGWVKNLRDGRVEAMIQGPEPAVQELLGLMRKGPSAAGVDKLEATPEGVTERIKDFEILY